MINLPNILTLSNLFCGCLAILLCIAGEKQTAVYLVLLAGIFDFFDGFAARFFKTDSKFGAELDSLADMVTFGLFPGILFYTLISENFAGEKLICWQAVPAFLFTLCAALRLAKFNISTEQTHYFKGLATPAATLFVCGIPFIESNLAYLAFVDKFVLYFWIVALSLLMVSNLKLIAFKFKDYTFSNNVMKYVLLALSIILLICFKLQALPTVILIYLVCSFINFKILKKAN